MERQTRLKREAPERTGPVRQAAGGPFAERPSPPGDPVPANGTAVDPGIETARIVMEAADEAVKGAVERGVETAYRVFEEYMLRGQVAAGREHERSDGRNGMTGYQQNSGLWGPPVYMMNPWMQLMQMWAGGLAPFVPGGASMARTWNACDPCGDRRAEDPCRPVRDPCGGRSATDECPTLAVKVSSTKRAEVTADVEPGAQCQHLRADIFSATATDGPNPTVKFECPRRGHVLVHVFVPDEAPAAEYTGDIKDNSGKVGEVRVKVSQRADDASEASASAAAVLFFKLRAEQPEALKLWVEHPEALEFWVEHPEALKFLAEKPEALKFLADKPEALKFAAERNAAEDKPKKAG